jgi:hypothetical protein
MLMAVLVLGVLSTPVTYRGGSTAAHPHMFLQLWQDAQSGSFAHHVASDGHGHHGEHQAAEAVAPEADQWLTAADGAYERVTRFVVSDWGVPALLAKPVLPPAFDSGRGRLLPDFAGSHSGRNPVPDVPPPQRV